MAAAFTVGRKVVGYGSSRRPLLYYVKCEPANVANNWNECTLCRSYPNARMMNVFPPAPTREFHHLPTDFTVRRYTNGTKTKRITGHTRISKRRHICSVTTATEDEPAQWRAGVPEGVCRLQGARDLLSPFPWQAYAMAAVESEGLALQHTMSLGLPGEAD